MQLGHTSAYTCLQLHVMQIFSAGTVWLLMFARLIADRCTLIHQVCRACLELEYTPCL